MCGCVCVFVMCSYCVGNRSLLALHPLQPICSWLWWIPLSGKGVITTPLPFIHISMRTQDLSNGKTHSHIYGWLCSLLCYNSLYWHYCQLPGWQIVSATVQPLRCSEHLTAVIYDHCVLLLRFFFFSSCTATPKTSAQLHVAQHFSLFLVCLAIKVILILITVCNTSLDTEAHRIDSQAHKRGR